MSRASNGRKLEFTAQSEMTVEQLLRQNGFSKGLIIELKKTADGIVIDGGRVRSTTVIAAGKTLEVNLPNIEVRRAKSSVQIPIIYEDEDIIVYNKPSGIACHRSGSHISDTIENTFDGVFRAVTRLDRDTSGVLLVAKHQLAAGRLWQKTSKRYIAIAQGYFERIHGRIELPIMRCRPYDMRRIVDECGDPSLTEYHVISQGSDAALVECILHTGRTHQARVHLSAIGHPIVGDSFYGANDSIMRRQALHCAKLSFVHPMTGALMEFTAAPPEDMLAAMAQLGITLTTEWNDNIKITDTNGR